MGSQSWARLSPWTELKVELETWQMITDFIKLMHWYKSSKMWLGTGGLSESPGWFLGAARTEKKCSQWKVHTVT